MLKNLQRITLVTAFLVTAPALAQEVRDDALKGKQILFVVGKTAKDAPNDDPLIRDYLGTLGAQVTTASATDPATAANGKDLVLISSTVNARELGNRYRDLRTLMAAGAGAAVTSEAGSPASSSMPSSCCSSLPARPASSGLRWPRRLRRRRRIGRVDRHHVVAIGSQCRGRVGGDDRLALVGGIAGQQPDTQQQRRPPESAQHGERSDPYDGAARRGTDSLVRIAASAAMPPELTIRHEH